MAQARVLAFQLSPANAPSSRWRRQSTSRKIRTLYSAVNRRRFAFGVTSGSGAGASVDPFTDGFVSLISFISSFSPPPCCRVNSEQRLSHAMLAHRDLQPRLVSCLRSAQIPLGAQHIAPKTE